MQTPAITPKPGHSLGEICWGDAKVTVEFWLDFDGSAVIEGFVINGHYIKPTEHDVDMMCRWAKQLDEEAQAQAEDIAESLAFDAYRERAERMGWAA